MKIVHNGNQNSKQWNKNDEIQTPNEMKMIQTPEKIKNREIETNTIIPKL